MQPSTALHQHPDRALLHNEVHARPPEALATPLAITHVVMLADADGRAASRAHLAALLRDHHQPLPDDHTTHLRASLGPLRLRWELHTEFVTWTFMLPMATPPAAERVADSAAAEVPQDWLAALPGQCLSQLNLWVLSARDGEVEALARHWLHEDPQVGSSVAGGLAEVYTDFTIHADGASRMLLRVGSLSTRRLGRLVQRLLEIETYRMVAMLGLPAARRASAVLASAEGELAALAEAIRSADRDAEPALLDRLTRLAGQVESQHAATHSRFSASSAYFELMDSRIADIAEVRRAGLQTIAEFMDRRLTPARKTCEWAARRQDALSQRVSRISNLLRTRVEIEQQQSSQALLATMNTRQDLQLKLQSTVEGLSVAAITYYIVGLVSYLAKGAQKLGWPWSAESTAALAIPLVAGSVWWSLRQLHRRMFSH
ncbi:DUF3422 family protein [Pseudorhodoferax sp. Leaf265]|jgi:uncharacterized membrane-anchored protein|uniref:DUF3422 family protein n=1 Tax=Pseudorhodoferax sp. Leaf265 TaxID=1736315 RepID=UPI0006F36576|nr:DUF3422 domain-containing protein [Pseudorhodoferax sp. Leaf265]KQP02931.1 hypothetical protein ASF45_16920 [Pseudorhodoferax sp. Leaf265]